jgi:hypothetical protein
MKWNWNFFKQKKVSLKDDFWSINCNKIWFSWFSYLKEWTLLLNVLIFFKFETLIGSVSTCVLTTPTSDVNIIWNDLPLNFGFGISSSTELLSWTISCCTGVSNESI